MDTTSNLASPLDAVGPPVVVRLERRAWFQHLAISGTVDAALLSELMAAIRETAGEPVIINLRDASLVGFPGAVALFKRPQARHWTVLVRRPADGAGDRDFG